ncbi:hypothetical protein D3C75_1047390 [compost metagenome]
MRQECFGAVHHPPPIDVGYPDILFIAAAFDGARVCNACVVEDQVDLAVLFGDPIRPRVHLLAVGDVHYRSGHANADELQCLPCTFQPLRVDIG